MKRRAKAAALIVGLMGAWIVPDNSSAFPVPTPLLPAERSARAIQHVGWACGAYRCRMWARQSNRAIGRENFRGFLAQLTPYLNCCHHSRVPSFGYSYGPEVSFDYDPLRPFR